MLNIFQMSILILFHPKDTLDIIKRERYKFRFSIVLWLMLAMAIVNYTYTFYVNYIFASKTIEQASILLDLAIAFLPIITWVVSAYAVTAILVGECSFTELFTASCYCLVPIIVLKRILGLLSIVLTNDEAGIFSGLTFIMYAWTVILLFLALQRLNDYSIMKTICVVVISILAMLIIWGVILLMFTLFAQVVEFVQNIIKEIQLKY